MGTEASDDPRAPDPQLAQAFVAIKCLRLLLFELLVERAMLESDPVEHVRQRERRLKNAVDGGSADSVAGYPAEYIKHGLLSEIERTMRNVEEGVAAAVDARRGTQSPRGPKAGV